MAFELGAFPAGGGEPLGVWPCGWFGDVAEVFEPELFGLGLASGDGGLEPWPVELLGLLDSLVDPG